MQIIDTCNQHILLGHHMVEDLARYTQGCQYIMFDHPQSSIVDITVDQGPIHIESDGFEHDRSMCIGGYKCQVRVVAPLLFKAAFNFAFYPRVPGRSSPLYELAPMGSRRFTKSPEMSPPGGSSYGRNCVVSEPLPRLSPYRLTPVHLALGGGNFLSWIQSYRRPLSLS